jgi:hypothetical protein
MQRHDQLAMQDGFLIEHHKRVPELTLPKSWRIGIRFADAVDESNQFATAEWHAHPASDLREFDASANGG